MTAGKQIDGNKSLKGIANIYAVQFAQAKQYEREQKEKFEEWNDNKKNNIIRFRRFRNRFREVNDDVFEKSLLNSYQQSIIKRFKNIKSKAKL